jgi:hypothetical protein
METNKIKYFPSRGIGRGKLKSKECQSKSRRGGAGAKYIC